jgi:formylglycine-generating enzyme required for sulfatase activity
MMPVQTQNRKFALGLLIAAFVCLQPVAPHGSQAPGKPEQETSILIQNPLDGLKYVWISPGTFSMGCSSGDHDCSFDEKPLHTVKISHGFWMGQTVVTEDAYKRFAAASHRPMPAPPNVQGWSHGNFPMVNVSWEDAQAFCQWGGGRLPTEAEWEYAARAGSTEARYGPIDQIAWYASNSGTGIHPVAQKQPNKFGLYDVLGNVWKWVADWESDKYYETSPSTDPMGPESGGDHVLRGGSWVSNPKDVRVSVRGRTKQTSGAPSIGFRCVQEEPAR